jgi:hypothetical protein
MDGVSGGGTHLHAKQALLDDIVAGGRKEGVYGFVTWPYGGGVNREMLCRHDVQAKTDWCARAEESPPRIRTCVFCALEASSDLVNAVLARVKDAGGCQTFATRRRPSPSTSRRIHLSAGLSTFPNHPPSDQQLPINVYVILRTNQCSLRLFLKVVVQITVREFKSLRTCLP